MGEGLCLTVPEKGGDDVKGKLGPFLGIGSRLIGGPSPRVGFCFFFFSPASWCGVLPGKPRSCQEPRATNHMACMACMACMADGWLDEDGGGHGICICTLSLTNRQPPASWQPCPNYRVPVTNIATSASQSHRPCRVFFRDGFCLSLPAPLSVLALGSLSLAVCVRASAS